MNKQTGRQWRDREFEELVEAIESLGPEEEPAKTDGGTREDYFVSRQVRGSAFSEALAGTLADAIVTATARGDSQADVAALYHEMLWLTIKPSNPAWRKAAEAIQARWPRGGFTRVKERAWRLYDQVAEASRRARAKVEGFDVAEAG